ncbi:MAG: cation-translocating P-type ATPase [Oscillospiraceae bacterium]|nr:cation-translocating P-type ATPase [Oscillospiraceae bacterium]
MASWEKIAIHDVVDKLSTDVQKGLSQQQVEARQRQYGLNEFEEEKKETLLQKILHHLSEIPTIVLMVAAAIATAAAIMNQQNTGVSSFADWAKVAVILSIVVLNVVLGLYQESKSEKALDALKKMNAFKTTVIRGGVKQVVEANQLVPGDIVELAAGDVITADSRLIEMSSLQVEEAALTGESEPVMKDPTILIDTADEVPLGDRLNMAYSGCLVTGGRATAVVVATAMETEMGKIAGLLNNTQKLMTPLQIKLRQLAKRISVIALISGVGMFLVGFLLWQNAAIDMLLLAVALGVAAVPETLPIIVTMILSYGVFNMVKKKTVIRKIPAVETVGNTSVICSDKTGTLTMNKMQIQKLWYVGRRPHHAAEEFTEDEIYLLELLASCSNATIEVHGDEDEHVIGDPTEIAIIRLLHDKGLTRVDAERQYPRVHELPFDSDRKRMTTVHHNGKGEQYIVVTKGAFDRLPVDWDPETLREATEVHDSFTDEALRVIALGFKIYDKMPEDLSEAGLERDLTFLGMVGMIDPPRPESKEAVARAREAGIKTVMITGDHVGTAKAIAKEIGIMAPGDAAVTGSELALMTDEQLHERVRNISVYARVSPEDKIRIVQAWLAHGEVIAMTGDGVNDAPALKAADVGIAMGITGTEVSKNAADMVITDDNFATIIDAISEGRTSFDNIRKTIQFLLGVNFAEIFVLLFGMLVIGVSPITALQILIINVVYDGIPGFFLAFERPEPGVMKRKPIKKGTSVFANRVGFFIVARATSFALLTMAAFFIGAYLLPHTVGYSAWDGSWVGLRAGDFAVGITMAFMTLSWASTIDIFNTRTQLSIFKAGFTTNRGVFYSVLGALAFSLLVALWTPLAQIFNVVPISLAHWAIIAGLASLQIVVVEIIKLVVRRKQAAKETETA